MSDQFPSLSDILAAHSIRQDYNHPAWGKCRCGFDPDPGWDDDAMTDEEINSWPSQSQHQAEVWREACTVTTVEQLDALPEGTVIHTVEHTGELPEDTYGSGAWTKHRDSTGDWYWWGMDFGESADEIPLPARVIHNPDWETK